MELKIASQVAVLVKCSVQNVRYWAARNNVEKLGKEYAFTEADISRFLERKKLPGRVPKPKSPKGKPGRPRKEKPIDTTPKRPRGRPRKFC